MNLIEVYRKNDRILEVTVQDEDGVVIDLAGSSLTFKVAQGNTVVFSKSTSPGQGITITDAAAGMAEIEITNTDTDITPGWYKYELLYTNTAGQRYTTDAGRFGIIETITVG